MQFSITQQIWSLFKTVAYVVWLCVTIATFTLWSLKCFIPLCLFVCLLFFHMFFISCPSMLCNVMIPRILYANKLHGAHTVFIEKSTYSQTVNKFPPILNQKFHYRVVCWRPIKPITLFIKTSHCSYAVSLAFSI